MFLLLPLFSAIYGLAAAVLFRRFTNRARIRRTVDLITAHLMELRLFLDSPALVLRAQRDLLRENLKLLRLVFIPAAISLLIFLALFPGLDTMFGRAPLPVGEPSVVTFHVPGAAVPTLAMEVPPGIEIQTPGVRIIHDREISWRLRPLGRTSGDLKIHYLGRVLQKRVVAGAGLIYGWSIPFAQPAIEIRYPRATIFGLSWMVWFFAISTTVGAIGAIRYRR
jgi:hypothetical protein